MVTADELMSEGTYADRCIRKVDGAGPYADYIACLLSTGKRYAI